MTELKPRFYRLEGQKAIPCADVLEWAKWFEKSDEARQVAFDRVGEVAVSTCFIGIGGPLRVFNQMFETRIFGGPREGRVERTETWDEAVSSHARALAIVIADEE